MKLNTLLALFSIALAVHADVDAAEKSEEHQESSSSLTVPLYYDNGVINLEKFNKQLQECHVVKELNLELSKQEEEEHDSQSYIEYVFSKLFPFGPAGNALLATTYISGPPNFILALIPSNIDVSSLSLLVSFAVGGLLGDVFVHLLPQTFLGEPIDKTKASLILVDEKRNVLLGIAIFIGFMLFFTIDKSLRILEHTGEEGEGHGHSHSHSHTSSVSPIESVASATGAILETEESIKQRKSEKSGEQVLTAGNADGPVVSKPSASVKTSAYLNLISDFTHNITDGLAISTSFYISKSVGCTTCLAVFFHEIPHEVGDFALLIQGGFTKWQAMNSQFLTAIGAYLGTLLGIAIQEFGSGSHAGAGKDDIVPYVSRGLLGTTVEFGDLTLPFTAGGFLYIGFSVVPELLELGKGTTRGQEIVTFVGQIFFVIVGFGVMSFIAWNE
ncbi:unnamed protein product [Ambrosiozyma monospora]|uniref:Unnamed protein product n=1 Tax=Ambrosiozyma monospora TaxID=43982 RepID=A0A9W6YS04_AMBMO|nr:unnamed protein product [Ambrosiozyma monospora]